jgi:protein archease
VSQRLAHRPVRAGYRLLPHTADLVVSAWAPTAAGCVDQAVRALAASFALVVGWPPTRPVEFTVTGADDAELLVRVLDEAIYLLDADDLVAIGAQARRTAGGGLAGHFTTVPRSAVQQIGAVPKAISRHRLRFDRAEGGWRCTVTVDV